MPDMLFEKNEGVRRFARLCAAFAKFYFDDRNWLVAGARRQVLDELTNRVAQLQGKNDVFSLMTYPDRFNWKVTNHTVEVDMARMSRMYLRGCKMFAGTREPLDIVLGSIAAGSSMERLKGANPFLADAHVLAARIYAEAHPRRGRPRRLADANPTMTPRVRRVVRLATA